MKYNLFLDDIRDPKMAYDTCVRDERYKNEEWEVVRDYKEFIKIIALKGIPDLVSFDHDLNDIHYINYMKNDKKYYEKDEEKTGYQCLKWLIEYCMTNDEKIPECIFHTANVVGKKNMITYYMNALKKENKTEE